MVELRIVQEGDAEDDRSVESIQEQVVAVSHRQPVSLPAPIPKAWVEESKYGVSYTHTHTHVPAHANAHARACAHKHTHIYTHRESIIESKLEGPWQISTQV